MRERPASYGPPAGPLFLLGIDAGLLRAVAVLDTTGQSPLPGKHPERRLLQERRGVRGSSQRSQGHMAEFVTCSRHRASFRRHPSVAGPVE